MTQTVSVVAITSVMRGGAHRAIRSHCLVFDATPGPAATLLPIPADNLVSYRVVLAGPFTTEQQARVRQMHHVRRQNVDDVLRFYQQHNVFYELVTIDCSDVPLDAVAENLLVEDVDADVEAAEMDVEHDRVGSEWENDASSVEIDVVERRVVFISDDREVSTEQATSQVEFREHAPQSASQFQFLVRHSTQFAQPDASLFARMFPHLFPYGRGHPGEQRHVPVAFNACIRYYAMLSSRRFAEDELFMLASFDYLSLHRMYTQVALKCQRNPVMFEPYSNISEEALRDALTDKELRRQGRKTSTRSQDSSAAAFLKTVDISGSAMWGSDGERTQCRRRAFAYQARFGQPALFVTLTPDVAGSFVMAQYCGITSVDTLFDAALADPPGRSAMNSASMRNDVASARLFMRNINAFVEYVLGVPLNEMKGRPFDGLFGDVKAYFGMVETQGGGTLHDHFLVWLPDAPPNTDAFDRALDAHGDQYYRDIEAFTDSIVSTSMPIRVVDSSCVFCGQSYPDLQELPISPEAYQDPNKHHRSHGARGEPKLVRCSGCSTALSSQHVIRRLLLDHRPASWPPPMRPYASAELASAVRLETSCRGSVAAAKAAIYRRDLHLFTIQKNSDDDEYGNFLREWNQVPHRLEQREEDSFRDDAVSRALAMLPPSVGDTRWMPRAVTFAVSMLVFLLNLHWWSHVGSCFKKSRVSASGQCRYGFTRARRTQTCCSSDGVTLARRTPFEYVNGFNREILLAFRSNHDIQVMIGGRNALLRIYYTTKYVTKMQEQVDSVTAVALATFKRRQLREARNDDASGENQSICPQQRAILGRRRVTSLLYAITNRREIAGPLAALYVLRGSCAYMSTPCAPLPLGNVLHELVEQTIHPCDLIELQRHNSDEVTFRAASFLDDYLFRPLALSEFSLYEFVATHFRRKRTASTAHVVLYLPEHPIFNTHCVGAHMREVVPVVSGMRMPFVDGESSEEIVIKRSQCARVLFKQFRAVTDLVADPTNGNEWQNVFSQWQPTRTAFTCQIMANMDDYSRVAKRAVECTETNGAERANSDNESDDDDITGTRYDVETMLDRVDTACELSAISIAPEIDAFNSPFDDDDDRLPIFSSASSSISSRSFQDLLGVTAQTTSVTAVDFDAVFVTPENATRLAVNNAFVTETAAMLPSDVFPVRVLANVKGALNGLSHSDLRYVLSLPDNRFGRMAPYLDLIIGMPVQVTQNVATAKGIANGTLGNLESVHFPDNTTFRLVRDGATNTVVQLPSRPPDYAVLRVAHRPIATPIRPELDPELFLVLYTTEAYQKLTITLPKAPNGRTHTVAVTPQQLPFVCAVGSTVYKVQGETLESMVVMDWKSQQHIINRPQQTYLLVPRVTSRHALVALAPFTNELAAWSKPPASALNEEDRLWRLSDVTLKKFQQSLPVDAADATMEADL